MTRCAVAGSIHSEGGVSAARKCKDAIRKENAMRIRRMGHLHCAGAEASVQHFRLHDFVLLVYFVPMNFRRATGADTSLLAALNHQLIRDEGHRNRMTIDELERRMRQWLETEYSAVLFEENMKVVA